MTGRCFVLETADREIEAQVGWYAEHAGGAVAERFYRGIRATIDAASERPGLGRRFESASSELVGVRYRLVRGFPFRVYYRVVDEGVEILHIRHHARDQAAALRRGG